jgi:hypothetical protein
MGRRISKQSALLLGYLLGLGVALLMIAESDDRHDGYCEYPPRLSIQYAHCTGNAVPAGEGWVYRGVVAPGARFYARYPEHDGKLKDTDQPGD